MTYGQTEHGGRGNATERHGSVENTRKRRSVDTAVVNNSAISATPATQGQSGAAQGVLVAAILGSGMVFLDSSVVNVALPVLQASFRATSADMQWVIEGYALFLATLLLVGGALGDRFGRRRIFVFGILLFVAASMWCGLAPSVGQLIVARAVQGIGGALLTPGSLAMITAAFSAETRGRAIGTWSGFTTITAALGPLVGGWLIQAISWRAIFFLNVPLAAATLLITARYVPESRDLADTGRIDYPGAVLATLGLGGIVYALTAASISGFGQPGVLVPLLVGGVFLVGFIAVEARSAAPMMPLGVFKNRTFTGTNLLTLLLYGALGGALYFLPFNLQQIQGYTPLQSGLSLLPFTIIMFSLSRWAGGLINRFGSRLPLIVGPSIAGLGFLLFARPSIGGSYWLTYFPAVLLLALGMTITVAPLTTTVMGAIEQSRAGIASGINNAVARTAGLLAIAALGIAVSVYFAHVLGQQLATSSIDLATRQAVMAQSHKLADITVTGVSAATAAAVHHTVQVAYVAGFRLAMFIGAGLAFASAICAALFVPGKQAGNQKNGNAE
jgi:EmrB/QacA subfamily drug resistance transporter